MSELGVNGLKVKIMKWEYQVVKAESSENFQTSLNALGGEGWEAISGGYMIGEPRRVTLGQGMAPSMAAGVCGPPL